MNNSISLFVPGRLCLFGEHSDWAGLQRSINADIVPGAAIVTGIEQGIYADITKSDKFIMRNNSEELKDSWVDLEAEMNTESLKKIASDNSYFSYVTGVASYVNEHYHVGGLDITIVKMDLPIKSGLSSSAAICVLIARAFNLLYGLNLNTIGEMVAAYKGERRTSSRCGRLDQACAFGISPVVMTFDGEEIDVKRLVVKEPLHWVIANLRSEKNTLKILADLNRCYPFPENQVDRNVHAALGVDNQNIISRAAQYIKNGDKKLLGALMTEAQRLFDEKVAPASNEQLRAPKLHQFLNDEKILSLTYGGKGVGSQGDGTAQFLAKDEDSQKQLTDYLNSAGLDAISFILPKRHQIRKAVIPIAGYGTRLYPATRIIKKEFIPIIDTDGLLKPIILILLEELYDCGIEEICLVVGGEDDVAFYKNCFQKPLLEGYHQKLDHTAREYEKKISQIGQRLVFCIQKERQGFGHAVFQSRDFCMDEPVLLMLGDTVYKSDTNKSCCTQLIEMYEQINTPIVSINEIPLDMVSHYGVLSGEWVDEAQTIMSVGKFAEKPDVNYSKKYLAVKNRYDADSYYSVFGQYVITPAVFREIEKNIQKGKMINGEYQLTCALEALIYSDGLFAVKLAGKMFDIGNREAYRNTLSMFDCH